MRLLVGATPNVLRNKIFEELRTINARHGEALLLVLGQYSLQTNRQLLEELDTRVTMDIQVASLEVFTNKVLERVGGNTLPYVNEGGRRMLAQYLLSAHREELTILARGYDQRGVAQKMLETLTEFRQMELSAEEMRTLCETKDVPPLLANKLHDMALLLEAYETVLGTQRLDNEARLFLLSEKIAQADWLKGLPIYIDGFHYLAMPELGVLKALEAMGADVTMTMVLPPEALTEKVGWWTMHSAVQAAMRFYGTLEQVGMPLHVETVGDDETMFTEAVALSKYLFTYDMVPYEGESNHVEIWKATSPENEMIYLAGMMRRMVFEEGLRWRDFHITTNQPDVYFPLAERIFKQYGIPVFVDARKPIDSHYLVRYLLNALDMVAYRFSYPMVFACLKTGLSGLSDAEIVALDYFARAKHLRGTMYFDARYFEPPNPDVKSNKLESLRDCQPLAAVAQEKFTARFQPFYEDLKQATTVRDFAAILYHFMAMPEVLDVLYAQDANKSPEQLEIDTHIVDVVVELLDQLVVTIGNMAVSLEQFTKILSEGLADASLGMLPPAQDEVQLVELGRARTARCKVAVVVGLSDAWMPKSSAAHTVFIREEKKWLEKEAGVLLQTDDGRAIEDEALSFYETLTKPTERLILSYPLSGSDGAAMNESVMITRAKAILPTVQEKSLLSAMEEVRPYLEWETLKVAADWMRRYAETPALAAENLDHVTQVASVYEYFTQTRPSLAPFLAEGLYYNNLREAISPAVVKQLYPAVQKEKLSISELENWQGCPYKHFMRYGIRPAEMLEYTLRSDELGNVIHGCLEQFTRDLKTNPDWLEWDDAAICAQMDKYLEVEEIRWIDEARSAEARNKAVLRKMKNQSHKAGRFIIRQLRESKFQPSFNEVFFGEESKLFPPIYLDIDGQIIRIEGRIDRVDTWKNGSHLYARVIDYKSGSNTFDISRVWAGLDLQLMLYLRAVLGWNKGPMPAGVFYLSLKKPVVDEESLDDSVIEEAIAEQLLMDGVFIDDPDVIAALDEGAKEAKPQVIALKGRKKTEPDNSLSADLLEKLLDHTVHAAENCVRSVLDGDIRVFPIEGKERGGCEYCDYAAICRFENHRSGNRERTIDKMTWKAVKEALEKEEEGNA